MWDEFLRMVLYIKYVLKKMEKIGMFLTVYIILSPKTQPRADPE